MKIIWESGDIATVEDNIDAGWCSGMDVELIEHIPVEQPGDEDRWVVKRYEYGSQEKGSVETIYLRPA